MDIKKYNFKEIKKFLDKHKHLIKEASLGIHEDWFWTAEVIFKEGKYINDLQETTTVSNITGSKWGTPVLEVKWEKGHINNYKCYTGKSDESWTEKHEYGELSGPVNEARSALYLGELGEELT